MAFWSAQVAFRLHILARIFPRGADQNPRQGPQPFQVLVMQPDKVGAFLQPRGSIVLGQLGVTIEEPQHLDSGSGETNAGTGNDGICRRRRSAGKQNPHATQICLRNYRTG